jgi:hypothetical protein
MRKDLDGYSTIEMDNEEYDMVPMEPMMPMNEYIPVNQTIRTNEERYNEERYDEERYNEEQPINNMPREALCPDDDMEFVPMNNMMPMQCGFIPYGSMMYMDYSMPLMNRQYYMNQQPYMNEEFNNIEEEDESRKKKKGKKSDYDKDKYDYKKKYHDYDYKDINRIVRMIERYNPGIYRRMRMYGIPYPEANRLVRRIVRLSLMYYDY